MGFRLLEEKERKMQRIFAILAIIDIQTKKPRALTRGFLISGGTDGTRTRDPCVTGRYSNRLNYRSTEFFYNHRFYDRLTA